MTDLNSKRNVNIAYIGGGSMDFGWKFISEICLEPSLSGAVRLYDIEKKLALANEVVGNGCRELDSSRCDIIFYAVDTPEEALKGADFVILSFSQGNTFEQMTDLSVPEEFGIYQASGDSSGPGGIMRGIRMIPEYIKYAKLIEKCCPDAWVISLSEPMSACIKTLYRVFPKIKAFGSSNEVFSTQEILADIVAGRNGKATVPLRDIKTNVIGINKLTWFTDATYDGESLFDIYADFARKYADDPNGYDKRRLDIKTNPYASANKVKFDLFLRYGQIAAANDRYLADSCPPWYVKTPQTADSWKLGRMTANFMKILKTERLNKCRKILNGEDNLRLGWSHTDVILQIKAILGLCNIITNAVMINHGQVENLPMGTVVETNAFFSKNSVKPTMAGTLPEDILSLTLRQVHNTNMLVDAVLEKSLDYAFNAFLNDPLMTLDMATASDCFKKMLSENKKHLGYYCD